MIGAACDRTGGAVSAGVRTGVLCAVGGGGVNCTTGEGAAGGGITGGGITGGGITGED